MGNDDHRSEPAVPKPIPRPELDTTAIVGQVDAVLADFLDAKSGQVLGTGADHRMPAGIVDILREFVFAGGKRIRPVLCVVGRHAADAGEETRTAIEVAAALEMFHAFALIHDDVMDGSERRRGLPTVHRRLREHRADHPDAGGFGAAAAVLVGDLALVWSDELLHRAIADSDCRAEVLQLVHAMRSELMYGQYLDLVSTGCPGDNVDTAMVVARYKTAHYTVERPLQIGVALAGGGSELLAACSDYGLNLGEAFQLRDDLLGTFGDPALTGKSAVDDLRTGKHTALVALGLRRADLHQRITLEALLGSPDLDEDGAATIREILIATGARAEVERMIAARRQQALAALTVAGFEPRATATLRRLAQVAVDPNYRGEKTARASPADRSQRPGCNRTGSCRRNS